jgi:adenylate cyclase
MRPPPRKLTVLASLDVAGYTRLVERDERAILTELARIRRGILRPLLATHSGHMFKTMGDGGLIEFPSVEDSVRWGIAFQSAMAERNAHSRPGEPIEVRLGIALADVFVTGADRYGAAVSFVVRLQEAAPPGGIAITHSVRWQLVKALAAEFAHIERVTLKGIDEPMEIWIWTPGGRAPGASAGHYGRQIPDFDRPAAAALPPAPPALPAHPSLAVLPFDNMSGDPAATTIADGLVEEITATLSRIRDFTVVARNSAYAALGGSARDLRQVSRDLGVRYLLEGSLRKAGDRVRVTAQLIDAETGAHIWADSYDGVVDNIFDFEDEIAERVAGALQPSIRAAEIEQARHKRPDSMAAYDLVLRALPHLWTHRPEANAEAIRLLDEAHRIDPDYGRAAAFAAWARAQQVAYTWAEDIGGTRTEGRRLIASAAEAVNDDPTALCALAAATTLLFGDLDRARGFLDRALLLDPNHAWGWARRGFLNVYRGEADAGTACFERAIRLSPLDPFSFNCYIGLGLARFAAGEPAAAVEWTRRAMREKSGLTWAYRDLAAFLAGAGRIDQARHAALRLRDTHPQLTLAQVADALRFMEPTLLSRYLGGLREAGLPEGEPPPPNPTA